MAYSRLNMMNKPFATLHLIRTKAVWLLSLSALCVLVLLCLPHKTKLFRTEAVLQNGKAMQVRVTLQSVWPWTQPERLLDLEVVLDGVTLHIPKEAYTKLGPFDSETKPLVDEWKGYPQITLLGRSGSGLNQASWWFQNYTFSALRKESNRQWEMTYYSCPAPEPLIRLPKQAGDTQGVYIAANQLTIKQAVIAQGTTGKVRTK